MYLEIENNSVSDVTNDASGSILVDVEDNSSTPNTVLHLHLNLAIKGKRMMKFMFLGL